MAKAMISVRVEEAYHEALVAEASAEDRSMAKQLERILRERYGSALIEGAGVPGVGEAATETADVEPPTPSMSADKIAAAGTDGKSSHTDSPPTAAAKRGASRRASPPAGST